jgi:ERCC4-related helicase
MIPGTKVKSSAFADKGMGTVISAQTIFNIGYVDVFFEKFHEKMTLPQDEIIVLDPPDINIKNKIYSSANLFMLRLFKEQIKTLITQEGIQSAGSFKILPLPHQLLAVNFIIDQFKPHTLIADEVGLGKTIEAALTYKELKARGIVKNVLIIAPSGLCEQWKEEMKFKFFDDFVIYDREMVASLKKLHGQETNIWTIHDKIITSIDFVKPKKISEEISERSLNNRKWHNIHVFDAVVNACFDMVIFDEAQKLTKDFSGEETARYKIGKALSETTPVLLLLSATPHQGDPAKFKNLLKLVDPYLFFKDSDVTPDNVRKVSVRNNKRATVDFDGNRLFKQRLTSLCIIDRNVGEDKPELDLYEAVTNYVSQFYNFAKQNNNRTMMFLLLIFQRMVSSSSKAIFKSLSTRLDKLQNIRHSIIADEDIPETDVDADELEDMSAEVQLRALESEAQLTADKYLDIEIKELQRCVSLAQVASTGRNDAKFRKLLEIVDEFRSRENNPKLKFIIFTEFVETQNYLNNCLTKLNYSTALINGSMSSEEKIKQKRQFQDEAQFLISTDAGGEGINLQFCWVMINYDLPWNPMRLEQRIGRIDRIGQKHDVKIVNFQIKGTVEQRVRDVIELKLAVVKAEFNDGEDKLSDILSTLDEEFSFDKIYIDAVIKRKVDADNLDELAHQIYLRAKEIINEGQLALPFTELEGKYSINKRDIEIKTEKAKLLLEKYLLSNGSKLVPYKNKEGVYYFDDSITKRRINNVIFNQNAAVENEDYELFSLSHPYIVKLMGHLDDELESYVTAKLQVSESKFLGEKGFLFIYKMHITNYIDQPKEYIISIYINLAGQVNNRISQFFSESNFVNASDLVIGELTFDINAMRKIAEKVASEKAEIAFIELREQMKQSITAMEQKLIKYYSDKEKALKRIAVENIRTAKLKELSNDMLDKQKELRQRNQIVPSLKCEQIAYVEFCS